PLRDDPLQHQTLGRVVLERRGAVMGRDGMRRDQKSGNRRDERDHCLSHRSLHTYFHASIAFLISDPAGCSLISIRIALGSVTFERRDPLFSLGRASATMAPACRNCITLAWASSEYRPICVNPAGLPLAGAISMNVSRLTC